MTNNKAPGDDISVDTVDEVEKAARAIFTSRNGGWDYNRYRAQAKSYRDDAKAALASLPTQNAPKASLANTSDSKASEVQTVGDEVERVAKAIYESNGIRGSWDMTLPMALSGPQMVEEYTRYARAALAAMPRQKVDEVEHMESCDCCQSFLKMEAEKDNIYRKFRNLMFNAERLMNMGWFEKSSCANKFQNDCMAMMKTAIIDAKPLIPDPAALSETKTPASLDNGWRTIDSAPKDGTRIMVWLEPLRRHEQFRHKTDWRDIAYWTEHNVGGWVHYLIGSPILWQPLPLPPSEANHE